MDKIVLGIDIGGTNMKVGRVENGIIIKQSFKSVDVKATKEETLLALFQTIDVVFDSAIEAIGIGVPAVVDPITGIVYDVQNIPAWTEIALKDIIAKRYNRPVFINNDANCFALGEKIFGKGREYENFIGLSIGTGIGMGIIINNGLHNGVLCGAGEVGMLPYKDGIIEDYVSSHFFVNTYNKTAKEMFESAREGDEVSLQAFNEFGLHLGECIKAILYMYAPEVIILGGSISNSFTFFEGSLKDSLKSFAYQKQIQDLKILISNYESIAILGAASLCVMLSDSTV